MSQFRLLVNELINVKVAIGENFIEALNILTGLCLIFEIRNVR